MRCFFNLAGAVRDEDQIGLEVGHLLEARVAAARELGQLIIDKPDMLWDDDGLRLEVTNEAALVLVTVTIFATDAPAVRDEPALFRPRSS